MRILLILFLTPFLSYSQDFPDGMVAVEFNASFNKANEVAWLSKLTDCETQRVDIAADSRWSKEYKIVVVPTIVIFNNNEEVKRFQANIMMTMEATKSEVQNSIDEIVMEAF
ncbi:MAG: hypothetical protein Unbinned8138contig1000_22 [Prokaryotic dsDNA virus sp.]|nr:MAG: hypothetical protein Unbinned8138contig1000_22 [Prokaryotic dsDNA virus sp.]|tara:strand:+ start:583 stop:918 length:336 start_codon:yes stop_codon:yes gene_type:complete